MDLPVYLAHRGLRVRDSGTFQGLSDLDMHIALVQAQSPHEIKDIGIFLLDVDVVDALSLELADLGLALGHIAGIVLVAYGNRDNRGPVDEFAEGDALFPVGQIEHLEDCGAGVVDSVL